MCEYAEIIQLLQELDGRIDRELSRKYTGRISRAIHALKNEQVKVERAILDSIAYDDACNGSCGLHNFN